MKTKILDCTLRDGGYVNDWKFGEVNIRSIIDKLIQAKIDIIEGGFLTAEDFDNDFSLFSSNEKILSFINQYKSEHNFVFMLNVKDFNEQIEDRLLSGAPNLYGIRLCFNPDEIEKTLQVGEKLVKKGYKIFFQPMRTCSYSEVDFISLIKNINRLSPYAFYIVDTFGSMYKDDLLRIFNLTDDNLKEDIRIGFHSHNNLQLAFSNAQDLLELETKREIIIDSSIFGMGRGAGNLSTELLTKYINNNLQGEYDIQPLLDIYEKNLASIYAEHPWEYSMTYFLSAMNDCHPNYATYLLAQSDVSKGMVNSETIANLFKSIPADKKNTYDEELIKKLYRSVQ